MLLTGLCITQKCEQQRPTYYFYIILVQFCKAIPSLQPSCFLLSLAVIALNSLYFFCSDFLRFGEKWSKSTWGANMELMAFPLGHFCQIQGEVPQHFTLSLDYFKRKVSGTESFLFKYWDFNSSTQSSKHACSCKTKPSNTIF